MRPFGATPHAHPFGRIEQPDAGIGAMRTGSARRLSGSIAS